MFKNGFIRDIMNENTDLKVYITLESELSGELKGTLLEGSMSEMKRTIRKWDEESYERNGDNDNENDVIFVDLTYYEGSKSDFKKLNKYLESL